MKRQPSIKVDVWEKNFAEAKVFFEEHGRFPRYSDNLHIRQWSLVWYRKFGQTDKIRLQRLEEIGFHPADRWRIWDRHYMQARKIWNETGRKVSMRTAPDTYNYFKQWLLHNTRRFPERAAMLVDIGFKIGGELELWYRNFNKARTFHAKHGRFPSRADNIYLAEWARQWYQSHAQDNPDKAQMLIDIGYVP